MARDYEASSGDHMIVSDAVQIRDYPITMACWAKVESHPATQETALMGVSRASASHFFQLGLYDLLGGDDSAAGFVDDGGTVDIYAASATVPTGQWKHFACIWTDPTTRKVFYGGTADTNTGSGTSFDPQNEDRFSIGAIRFSGTTQMHFDGKIAFPTVWRAALSDEEIDAMAAGVHPMLIRPTLQWGSYPNPDFWTGVSVAVPELSWAFSAHGSGEHGLGATLTDNGTNDAGDDYGPSQVYGFVGPL